MKIVQIAIALVLAVLVGAFIGVHIPKNQMLPVGASPSPDRFFQTESMNGVTYDYTRRFALVTATTTVCAIQSPNATSTLHTFAVKFTVGSTTAKQIVIAKGVAMQASTTVLGNNQLGANAQGTFEATTTTQTSGVWDMIIAPLNWINVSMVGGAGTDSPTGTCQATFERI